MGASTASERHRVLAYWTPRRMAAATPLGLLDLPGSLRAIGGALARPGLLGALAGAPRAGARPEPEPARRRTAGREAITAGSQWTAGGVVGRTTGRVFLTLNGADFVCSASTVRSASKDVVITAGHCVKDGAGAWAENWTFVPGYHEGAKPYGSYTARRLFVAGPWARQADDDHDVAMVALNSDGGRHVADAVGAQEISFAPVRGAQTYGFGFPAEPPYDGERLYYCAGRPRPDPYGGTEDQGLGCKLTAGASGGPWLTGFDPRTGHGTITSVSSFKYLDDPNTMYGPTFGPSTRELFATAERA
ncbi:trypsin-like serine peptidase [Thermocatellispora tengchongensis]|uniref:trypsin-like serine peptidase n=1 Tax=Thermocatellispora tengchongensis TaxID=1073253 RepID=UPI00363A071C